MWEKYDADNSGYLDKEETRIFIQESIHGDKFGKKKDPDDSDDEDEDEAKILSDKQFEACFDVIDSDQNGVIDRQEMMQFIKIMCDLDYEVNVAHDCDDHDEVNVHDDDVHHHD